MLPQRPELAPVALIPVAPTSRVEARSSVRFGLDASYIRFKFNKGLAKIKIKTKQKAKKDNERSYHTL